MQTFTKLTRCLGIPIKQCTLQSSHISYQNRTIGGNCLIFSNRKISCNRACSDFWCEEVENVCAYFTKTGLLRAYKRGTPRHRLYRLQIIRTHKRQYNPVIFCRHTTTRHSFYVTYAAPYLLPVSSIPRI